MTGPGAARDRRRIHAAGMLRAAGVGMTAVLLGVHLPRRGFAPDEIGAVVTAGLVGGAAATLLVGLRADRLGRRVVLVAVAALALLGGWGIALGDDLRLLVACAFLGMVNGMGRDRAAAFTLEQAILPSTAPADRRTAVFATYSLVLDVGHSVGAFAALLPIGLRALGVDEDLSYRASLGVAASLNAASLLVYLGLSRGVESPRRVLAPLSPRSRGIVARFAAVSAVDSLGGGFLSNALITAWFVTRFGVGEEVVAPLFAVGQVAHMLSYGAAVALARRFGLLNTMVFTHLPAHLLLMAMAFAPSVPVAVLLFVLRECLVEMDVPTRTAFLTSVVAPHERTAATGFTNVARLGAWAVGPRLAGEAMKGLALSAPFFIGGGIKIVYDVLLWREFRRVAPHPE